MGFRQSEGEFVPGELQADPELKNTKFAFLTATVSEVEVAPSRCYAGEQIYVPKLMPLEELEQFIEKQTAEAEA